jgi:hypothetical protein
MISLVQKITDYFISIRDKTYQLTIPSEIIDCLNRLASGHVEQEFNEYFKSSPINLYLPYF